MSKPIVAVIAAAGLGTRFGGSIPKQFRKISGQALVSLSVEALAAAGCTHGIIVIQPEMKPHFEKLLDGAPMPITFIAGGETRQESVHLGLQAIKNSAELAETEIILVHDAVRPLVPTQVVESVINAVKNGSTAVTPVVDLPDSIRQVNPDGSNHPIDRTTLRAIQTPQGFDAKTLIAAHEEAAKTGKTFTDDVTCCESFGQLVTLVPGSKLAIKVTEKSDLTTLEAFLKTSKTVVKERVSESIKKLLDRK